MPAIFNAANEIAVAGFIDGKIKFTSILPVIEAVVASQTGAEKTRPRDLADVSAIEDNARAQAHEQLVRLAP
jgi:1-deoxy-D-xylulose-5-phosphate reductoisomerase